MASVSESFAATDTDSLIACHSLAELLAEMLSFSFWLSTADQLSIID